MKRSVETLPRRADYVGLEAFIGVQQEDYLPEDQAELPERENSAGGLCGVSGYGRAKQAIALEESSRKRARISPRRSTLLRR